MRYCRFAVRENAAPPSIETAIAGLVRSIVVDVRLPWSAPLAHEFAPSGEYRLSLGSEYSPVAQIA